MIRFPRNIRAAGTGGWRRQFPGAYSTQWLSCESMGLKTHAVVAHRLQRRRRGSPHPVLIRAPLSHSLPLHFRNPPEKITPNVVFPNIKGVWIEWRGFERIIGEHAGKEGRPSKRQRNPGARPQTDESSAKSSRLEGRHSVKGVAFFRATGFPESYKVPESSLKTVPFGSGFAS